MNVESLFQEWRSSIDEAAKAKADEVYLREFRKSKKAMLMQEGKDEGHKTGQERESYAYAHPEYLELLDALRIATETNAKFQWRMKIAEERIGIYRTHEASKRKEFSNYGN
jgi:hypothetical protein